MDVALTETIVYGVREGESGGMGAGGAEEILDRSEKATALVVGPGIGTGAEGRARVEARLGGRERIRARPGKATALVVGPGIGTGEEGRALVEALLGGTDLPVLLDADAVTALAGADALARRDAPTGITPPAGRA